ncbi:RimK/LysX family protein [Patescibacteria group bacterium]|nr:RimK/LysX family protein [Patescibacteria group bacterium]MBU2579651.1 RimK/LysX family protein [Patescibacteria group bacterium]MBU4031071.1 RimK/LysX family protein [Patescibacteria group bacterium]MBU4082569.1 RimK/LysX family protein [Patescibacteria group bacterium]
MLNPLGKSKHILGLNARNLTYLRPSNNLRAVRIADNKLTTKRILKKAGLPVPETFSVVRQIKDLRDFDWAALPSSFVLKPNQGLGGEGILIVYGRKKKFPYSWVKADRSQLDNRDLESHALNILEGTFSRTGLPDIAFFEERVKLLKLLKPYSYRGIPDIRIIVYNSVPIMAEMRLPTRESGGKANLHLGGVGVGIDMGAGVTTTAIHRDRLIEYAPGTRLPLSGIQIPDWKDVLRLAIHAQEVTKIGFLGIDIALDREKGPVVLELNVRPGLSIQLANMSPLNERLKRVKGLKIKNASKGVKIAQDLFGGDVEEGLEEISGRKVIGINEPIEILDARKNKYPTMAKIDTGAYRTTICKNLAEQLGVMSQIVGYKKVRSVLGAAERPIINLSFILDKRLVAAEAFVADRSEMKYDIIIGRRDLKRFLVDPAKNVFMRGQK